jgi:hypothetical protein
VSKNGYNLQHGGMPEICNDTFNMLPSSYNKIGNLTARSGTGELNNITIPQPGLTNSANYLQIPSPSLNIDRNDTTHIPSLSVAGLPTRRPITIVLLRSISAIMTAWIMCLD